MRTFSPAAERSKTELAGRLQPFLPATGLVLELASGSGQHVAHFAACFPGLTFQPSDCTDVALASLRQWVSESARPNLLPPLRLDVLHEPWPCPRANAVLVCNLLHITREPVHRAVLSGAARILAPGEVLLLFGPFSRVALPPAPPERGAFAGWTLPSQPPESEALRRLAESQALALREVIETSQPSHFLLVFERTER